MRKPKRGRPVGYRKPGAVREVMHIRITDKTKEKLVKMAKRQKTTPAEMVRVLLESLT